jgi:hypothetical protein
MGGFASILGGKRKASRPAIQIIRNVASPVQVEKVSPLPSAPPTVSAGDDDASRIADIMRRSKGRAETVLTSFRGLLDGEQIRPQRKSLLGE